MSARFSPCRTWRYSLTREIADAQFGCLEEDERDAALTFVGLNPSTADETNDDPTVRRCISFARAWGFPRLHVVNLYGFRATDPRDLWLAADPVGPENDDVLAEIFTESQRIILAWGANARPERVAVFQAKFSAWQLWALGVTKHGAPRHPLYLRGDLLPFRYVLARAAA